MKIALYTVSYMGIWYDGPALRFEEIVKRAKDYGYDGIEPDGKRPHGHPMDLSRRTRISAVNTIATPTAASGPAPSTSRSRSPTMPISSA